MAVCVAGLRLGQPPRHNNREATRADQEGDPQVENFGINEHARRSAGGATGTPLGMFLGQKLEERQLHCSA